MVKDVESEECPVSLTQPWMEEVIAQYDRSKLLYSTTGASLFGTDIGDWPAKLLDSFAVLSDEEVKVQSLFKLAAGER